MNERTLNNFTVIYGEILEPFEFDHEVHGERFYSTMISVSRISETKDILPVTVSERLVDVKKDLTGTMVCIAGQFRSYNRHEENKNKLVLFVFAREWDFLEEEAGNTKTNQIFLDGFICKPPVYRKTPLGREIADLLIAVNRPYGKSDYIPCICWGRNARYISDLGVGTHIRLEGRVQSREYCKINEGGIAETRTSYEVSVVFIDIVEERN